MLKDMELKNNLDKDKFFEDQRYILVILDNYNICGMSYDAIKFYVRNLKDTGCRKILIYFNANLIQKSLMMIIKTLLIYKILIVFLFYCVY